MVEIFYEETNDLELDTRFFTDWLTELCASKDFSMGDVSLIFCSDEYLLELNKSALDHDFYTDIITFDYTSQSLVAGDLFISVDRVRENAREFKVGFLNELHRVVAHGVLHLLGYKDKSSDEEAEMRKQEELALNLIVSRGTI